jgi:long-chain alkane monooxygenase
MGPCGRDAADRRHGYNVTPHVMPSSISDFVDQVIPVLQKRGVYPTEYLGTTLRQNTELA